MLEITAQQIPDIRIDTADISKSVVFPLPERHPTRARPEHRELLELLRSGVLEKAGGYGRKGFSVEPFEGLQYRVQRIHDSVYLLRLCFSECLSLEALGHKSGLIEKLLSPKLKSSGGLVLISGLPGSGKTATLAATISGRLAALGGYAMSIEDPIEMPLAGFHGDYGFCEQSSVDLGETFYDKIVDSLRCFPSGDTSMLAIGEVRENDAAAELLRIGIDGHLVLSTVHAKGPLEAMQRVLTMAAQDGEASAKSLLANSLKLVVHQKLVGNKPVVSALEVTDKVRATILNGNINSLADDVRATDMKIRGEYAPSIR